MATRWQDPEVQGERRRMAEHRRSAFRAFMEAHGLKPAGLARQAGLPNANLLYAYLNGKTDSLSQDTINRLLGAVPGATLGEMLGETAQPIPVRVLPCRAEARAGTWQRDLRARVLREIEFPIPAKLQADELVKMGDDHADQVYPRGSYLVVEAMASLARELRINERVIVHAVRDGQHEMTVRQIAGSETAPVLVYPTLSRRGSLAAELAVPVWPYDGRQWTADGVRYQIEGRVVMMFLLEEPTYS